jgi:MFS family permease
MALGMTLIGAGVLWATRVHVHGHYIGNLLGPFAVAGAGTAFAFIPISIAGLAGVEEHRAGLASGLLNTTQNLGGAIGIAIASSIAASHTKAAAHRPHDAKALLHTGHTTPAALTGGYQHALWALGALALIALPAIFALVRRNEPSNRARKPTVREPEAALAPANGRINQPQPPQHPRRHNNVHHNRRQVSAGDRGQSWARAGAGRRGPQARRPSSVCRVAPAAGLPR